MILVQLRDWAENESEEDGLTSLIIWESEVWEMADVVYWAAQEALDSRKQIENQNKVIENLRKEVLHLRDECRKLRGKL